MGDRAGVGRWPGGWVRLELLRKARGCKAVSMPWANRARRWSIGTALAACIFPATRRPTTSGIDVCIGPWHMHWTKAQQLATEKRTHGGHAQHRVCLAGALGPLLLHLQQQQLHLQLQIEHHLQRAASASGTKGGQPQCLEGSKRTAGGSCTWGANTALPALCSQQSRSSCRLAWGLVEAAAALTAPPAGLHPAPGPARAAPRPSAPPPPAPGRRRKEPHGKQH